ncbi:MAG TPA: YARHG domain-containing protein, partial [Chitinophagaceae bacterium]|nr:YARHG domain-containing protein [Chitinophagaceae bacterium]
TKKTFSYNPENNFDESIVGASLYNGKDMEESSYEAITAKVTKINASTQKLNNKDVENLYKGDLEVIRNAIYARHGYSFRNRRMRYLFDNLVEWYVPSNVDVRNELTALEKDNIALIKRYEDHAEKYYDEFSR